MEQDLANQWYMIRTYNVVFVLCCDIRMFQVHVEYNVPSTGYEKCAFAITANGRTKTSSNDEETSTEAEIAVCVRYIVHYPCVKTC